MARGYFSRQINFVKGLLRFKAGMKALDIGAGLGKAMISMDKAGFDTYGFEPQSLFMKEQLVKCKFLRQKSEMQWSKILSIQKMSLILLHTVCFEHLYHPAQTLERTRRGKASGIVR